MAIRFINNLLQGFIQHEVDFVVLELLLEVVEVRLLVDLDVLDANHLGEVLPVLLVDVVGEGTVVSTTCENPCGSTNLEGRLRNPQGAGHGQMRHGLRLDALDFLRDQTEAIAKVNDGCLDTTASLGGEYQTGCLLLADTDAEEMNLKFGLICCNQRTDFEHVALQTR